MPAWNSSTCSHFLHFPSTTKRTLAVSHESKQTFLFQVISLTGPNSVLCCGDVPSRSPGSTCYSGAHYKHVLGPFPSSLKQKLWNDAQRSALSSVLLMPVRVKRQWHGGLDEVRCDHRDHCHSSALKGPPMPLCSCLVLSLSCCAIRR